ncbi:hypothetical protein IMCC3135_13165 [Granulosicoccus antarcticus IMCC3135]|uniref:Uncharacterized protein n=2 Tax=Granulosicoccus TaxID=437504 RepID=A0A2Z2NRU3_9GAMM|nr:hypothetical protein IMCC3135_13165 [Granulosicoccus antarcticus IMCC3135]
MGKRMSDRFDDDYFPEPNYDKLSDQELDELYYFGEIRTAVKPKKSGVKKSAVKKVAPKLFASDSDENWLDVDLNGDDDLYEDD